MAMYVGTELGVDPAGCITWDGSETTINWKNAAVMLEMDRFQFVDHKHQCDYCRSKSPDDYIGNCAACGAPRDG